VFVLLNDAASITDHKLLKDKANT